MKLKMYNTPTRVKTSKPCLSISKSGLILVNHAAVNALDLKAEDCIEFAQDLDRPKDWYVRKSQKIDAYTLRSTGKNSSLGFNNIQMVKTLCESLGITPQSLRFPLGESTDDNFHAIITRIATVHNNGN